MIKKLYKRIVGPTIIKFKDGTYGIRKLVCEKYKFRFEFFNFKNYKLGLYEYFLWTIDINNDVRNKNLNEVKEIIKKENELKRQLKYVVIEE